MAEPIAPRFARGHGVVALALVFFAGVGLLPALEPGPSPEAAFACGPGRRVHVETTPVWQWSPALALGRDGSLNVVWVDTARDLSDILFARSTDGGRTWGSEVVVNSETTGVQEAPDIAVSSDGAVLVVWRDGADGNLDVSFARSTDGGQTWSAAARVNDVSGFNQASQSIGPTVAASGGGALYVAWEDWRNGDPDIYLSRSLDRGRTWSPNVRVNDPSPAEQRGPPAVAAGAGGSVFLAWEDRRNGEQDPDVYFAASFDYGASWRPNVRVNDDATDAWQGLPGIATDGARLFLAWQDNRAGDGDIFFASSSNGGVSWTRNVRVNSDTDAGPASNPELWVRASAVYVAWDEFHPREAGSDVYASFSWDGGRTWSPSTRATSGDPGLRYIPSLVVDRYGRLHVAYVDESGGTSDIYAVACAGPAQIFVPTPVTKAPRILWRSLFSPASLGPEAVAARVFLPGA